MQLEYGFGGQLYSGGSLVDALDELDPSAVDDEDGVLLVTESVGNGFEGSWVVLVVPCGVSDADVASPSPPPDVVSSCRQPNRMRL